MATTPATRQETTVDITAPTRRIGAIALALTGVLHLVLVPEYLDEATTIGVLFLVGGLASLAGAVWLWAREDDRAWWLAVMLGLGMAVGFVLSRTVGLLGFLEGDWELSGIVSVVLELAIVAAFAWDRWQARESIVTR